MCRGLWVQCFPTEVLQLFAGREAPPWSAVVPRIISHWRTPPSQGLTRGLGSSGFASDRAEWRLCPPAHLDPCWEEQLLLRKSCATRAEVPITQTLRFRISFSPSFNSTRRTAKPILPARKHSASSTDGNHCPSSAGYQSHPQLYVQEWSPCGAQVPAAVGPTNTVVCYLELYFAWKCIVFPSF